MSEQTDKIKERIALLQAEQQRLLTELNASPAAHKVHEIAGAIAELRQLLPKEEPAQSTEKVVKFPKKKLGGKP